MMDRTFEECVDQLTNLVHRSLPLIGDFELVEEIKGALADLEEWEQSDDPIQNGWVGSDGRP